MCEKPNCDCPKLRYRGFLEMKAILTGKPMPSFYKRWGYNVLSWIFGLDNKSGFICLDKK